LNSDGGVNIPYGTPFKSGTLPAVFVTLMTTSPFLVWVPRIYMNHLAFAVFFGYPNGTPLANGTAEFAWHAIGVR
jgi:hypothetical protein